MPRWTGTWLSGPGVTLREMRHPDTWQGQRLDLPREGAGSLAPFGARAFAFAIDIVASAILASLLNVWVHHPSPVERQVASYAVLAAEHVLLVSLTGQTIGMRLMSLRVMKLSARTEVPGLVPACVRTIPLLVSIGLTGFFTKDGRGLHDVIARTAVVRV